MLQPVFASRFERFVAALEADPQLTVFDPKPLLLDLKSRYPVYCKTDHHWTSVASYFVGLELVARLGALGGRPIPWQTPEVIQWRDFAGSREAFLSLLQPRVERAPAIAPLEPLCGAVALSPFAPHPADGRQLGIAIRQLLRLPAQGANANPGHP
ncbi:MAG: hypothetical protein ACFCBW_07630 [Candidatus Competibacterales bacterium]